jgi:alpha-glucosidase (family GH31 glycosyl hydrolase)
MNLKTILSAAMCAMVSWLLNPAPAHAEPIRWWNQDVELSLSSVSDHTAKIVLAPFDDKGQPKAGLPSTVLVAPKLQATLRIRELKGAEKATVGKLNVTVTLNPLTITLNDGSGKTVQKLIFDDADGSMSFRTAGPVLGLGEGDHQFNRAGAQYRMVNGQLKGWLPTHGATIPVPFLIGTEGWAMFVHAPWGEFDLREGEGEAKGRGRFVPRKDARGKEPLEVYVIHTPEPAIALAEYIRLTGRPVMPPKWVLGYMQSHRTLAGPEEPVQIVQNFRDKKLPLDTVIYLGTGYCPAGWNLGHGTLDFNPMTFDRPAENIKALHALNVHIVLHINKAPRNLFGTSLQEPSDSPLHIRNYWARHLEVLKLGVDAWWPDDGDELPIEARLARHRCYYEGSLQDRPNVRPWSLHRNGYAGAQRYGGWIWSGDNESRWATLAAHVPVGVNYSLSLTPFWGTDCGGFVPTKELTGELYTRWFQFSAFNPLFRSHGRTWKLRLPWGWNTGDFGPVESNRGPDKSELHNADVEPICRKYLELRYRLLPYNYTLLREASDTGLPLMRTLWLHYPGDAEAVKLGDQYLWGRDLLIAPVVEQGAKERSVYLPAGTWYDWWTGAMVEGGGKGRIKRPVDLATMPIYVRAGAIVPLDPVRQYTAQTVTEPTTLQVYRGADGQFVLYDDDGKSLDYQKGQGTWTRITWNDAKRQLVFEPDARSGLAPTERAFEVLVLPERTQKRATYVGKRLEVAF